SGGEGWREGRRGEGGTGFFGDFPTNRGIGYWFPVVGEEMRNKGEGIVRPEFARIRVREEEMARGSGEERRGSTGEFAVMVDFLVVVSPAKGGGEDNGGEIRVER
ncbi:hypothetical protein HAX54_021600, partial [Datura stramonium]|nr:hypothetical protein [Datura stramonium]